MEASPTRESCKLRTPSRRVLWLKRGFDVVLALGLLPVAVPLMLLGALLIRATSKGPSLYWAVRVGRHNRHFKMPKLRTMRTDTPQLATHLMQEPLDYLTPLGSVLRMTSLDELPQLFSILKGDMSFVGPRPALFNQDDVIAMRTERGIEELIPGLTGWAQVNGRDELTPEEKVRYDEEYMRRFSFWFDLKILAMTAWKVVRIEGVIH